MASAESLQIYLDRISVHGLDFTELGMRKNLSIFVKKRTQITPTDILLGDDPKSAIVMFPVANLNGKCEFIYVYLYDLRIINLCMFY